MAGYEPDNNAERYARVTAIYTKVMGITTIVVALASLGSVWVLENQLDEAHQAGIDAHQQGLAANRAWIIVSSGSFAWALQPSGMNQAVGTVQLQDVGVSPAIGVSVERFSKMVPWGENLAVKDWQEDPEAGRSSETSYIGTIGRDMVLSSTLANSFPLLSSDEVKQSPPKAVYVTWGYISYRTPGDEELRRTTFCFYYSGSGLSACSNANNLE